MIDLGPQYAGDDEFATRLSWRGYVGAGIEPDYVAAPSFLARSAS